MSFNANLRHARDDGFGPMRYIEIWIRSYKITLALGLERWRQ